LWVTAVSQSGGRGRQGRAWVSEPGNLYASVVLIDPAPIERVGTLPLVVALAVHDALRPDFAALPDRLKIKWPNDILIDGAKVNGVLIESERLADGRLAVVAGIGVNVVSHPGSTPYPATDLRQAGAATGLDTLLGRLATAFSSRLGEWRAGTGFAHLRPAWKAAARGLGDEVSVRLADGEARGVFEDLDEEGYLCLATPTGRRRISAGDLFFIPASGTMK
ncbi:MAG: biotin--[acetyl-CoA-carboxylase] ligase, partial [Rhizobiaceae bacterium]